MGLRHEYSIADMLLGYCISQVLFTANGLDLFTLLDSNPLGTDEIAAKLRILPRPLQKLADACVGLGLLYKNDGCYATTALASRFLVKGKEEYYGEYVSLMAEYYQAWSRLRDAITEDRPIRREFADFVSRDPPWARRFTLAMHSAAVPFAPYLAKAIDLSRCKRLIDVGGGSGAYTLALLAAYPSLEAVIFDFPTVCEIADEIIQRTPSAGRITMCPGNYRVDSLPVGFDCALISQVLHAENHETCQRLLSKVYEALESDGMVIVQDAFLNDRKDGPISAQIYDLHWLLLTEEGRNYSVAEVRELLGCTGYVSVRIQNFGAPLESHVVVTGIKP